LQFSSPFNEFSDIFDEKRLKRGKGAVEMVDFANRKPTAGLSICDR